MTIELTSEQTRLLKAAINDTRQQGRQLVQSANNDYAGIVNVAWRGAAAVAGMIKKDEHLSIWNNKLEPLLDELEVGIGLTETLLVTADEEAAQEHNAIQADAGGAMPNFKRL